MLHLYSSYHPIFSLTVILLFTVISHSFVVEKLDLNVPETIGLGSGKKQAKFGILHFSSANARAEHSWLDSVSESASHVGQMSINKAGKNGADLLPGPEISEDEPPSPSSLDALFAPPPLVRHSHAFVAASASSSKSAPLVNPTSSDVGEIHPLEVSGSPQTGLYVSLDLGTPSQTLNLLIDTGSTTNAVACVPFDELSGEHFETSKYCGSDP